MAVLELSAKQERLLLAMVSYQLERGHPPSLREMQRLAEISSTSVVNYNLDRLSDMELATPRTGLARTRMATPAGVDFVAAHLV